MFIIGITELNINYEKMFVSIAHVSSAHTLITVVTLSFWYLLDVCEECQFTKILLDRITKSGEHFIEKLQQGKQVRGSKAQTNS